MASITKIVNDDMHWDLVMFGATCAASNMDHLITFGSVCVHPDNLSPFNLDKNYLDISYWFSRNNTDTILFRYALEFDRNLKDCPSEYHNHPFVSSEQQTSTPIDQISEFFKFNASSAYEVSKFLACLGTIISGSKVIDSKMGYFFCISLLASSAGNFASQLEGIIGKVGEFIKNNAIKIFATAGSCLISSKIAGKDASALQSSLAKIAASAIMPIISSSYGFIESKFEQLLLPNDRDKPQFEDVHFNITNSENNGVVQDLEFQLKFHFKNTFGRTLKEGIKNYWGASKLGSSLISESGANLIKQVFFPNNHTNMYFMPIILLSASAKVLGKTAVKHFTKTDYIIAGTGVIAGNVMNEFLINE